jgi:transposase-like protein
MAETSCVTTDGYRTYNRRSIPPRQHRQIVVKHLPENSPDPVLQAHQVISLVKRWWIGTYHGAISRKHLQVYLDEFEFRHNRRKTEGVGRIVARVLQILAASGPVTFASIRSSSPCPRFATA